MKQTLPIPVLRALRKFGQDISDSRRRRRIPLELMAERAGVSRATLGKIEKGDPTVSLGRYAPTICAGIDRTSKRFIDANHDTVGRMLRKKISPNAYDYLGEVTRMSNREIYVSIS